MKKSCYQYWDRSDCSYCTLNYGALVSPDSCSALRTFIRGYKTGHFASQT